ncbi:hypothetical protein IL306_013154 [Fusarium sp. DS 682]|nr:hypothetical protein IL306_013154 [Fusarium sp. DS 682]
MASQIDLCLQNTHISSSAETLQEANRLLQKNHDEWHIFFRQVTGHNHTAHSILTCLAMGAEPADIRRAYHDTQDIQREMPEVDLEMLKQLQDPGKLSGVLGTCDLYSTFLVFFQNEIEKYGWKEAVKHYVFSRTPLAEKMLVKMYEGMYHSLIHLGLGIEFQQPAIIAEALAQAACHEDGHISKLLLGSEALAESQDFAERPKPLVMLLSDVKRNSTIYDAPQWEDRWDRMRKGVMDQASGELAVIAAEFRIRPEELQRCTAEMISTSAYMAGASQRPGRKSKIDFFLMHGVTSSMFFSIFNNQEWIKLEDRIRLVEWKGRLDLAFYAFCHCPDLYRDSITNYHDDYTKDMNWDQLYAAVNKEHDDGHVAKVIRALHNGENAARDVEDADFAGNLPVNGDMWVKIARMALGSTHGMPPDLKWIMGTGFDQAWVRPDLQ